LYLNIEYAVNKHYASLSNNETTIPVDSAKYKEWAWAPGNKKKSIVTNNIPTFQ